MTVTPAGSTRRPAAGNVVKLTVHNNTLQKRRSRERRQRIIDHARSSEIASFVVVTFAEDGHATVQSDLSPGKLTEVALLLSSLAAAEHSVIDED